ncbi:Armadillo-like helical domain-containing protein 3 like [Verticillium longisporum]|nr:Armadillo-like helical domain-containing protein 3 like [Verticillium longisporum]
MEASPLTRQPQPEVFQPKIVLLYDSLFKDDDTIERGEGFWREFFLLRPDRPALQALLDGLSAADVLGLEERTRELFERGVEAVQGGGPNPGPSSATVQLHALETLSVFLAAVLGKKYAYPTSDVIAVLAGIDLVDTIFGEFAVALDQVIRAGKSLDLRSRAVEVVLSVTAGAYQTSLLTYFIQRDLFPAVMKYIHETEHPGQILEPYTLLGLLANYNKFEFQNPYQQRLSEIVNEPTIQQMIRCVGYACQKLRLDFVDVMDDLPEGWTFSNTLHMIGLGIVARGPKPEKKIVYDAETQKQMFAKLPGPEAALLLTTYDFTHKRGKSSRSRATSP